MSPRPAIPHQGAGRAGEMRIEFDSSFARIPTQPQGDLTDVLTLRIGDAPCMLRLSDIAEVIRRPVLTPVPTGTPALLGITTGRGVPVAAFDLGLLLGQATVGQRWLLLLAAEPEVGLVFEQFDGYQQLALGSAGSHRLVEIPALIDEIRQLSHGYRNTDLENES
jgi:CheW-like protein